MTSRTPPVVLTDPVDHLLRILARPVEGRHLVGLAGLPGSGNSTQAPARIAANDVLNAHTVLQSRHRADWLVAG